VGHSYIEELTAKRNLSRGARATRAAWVSIGAAGRQSACALLSRQSFLAGDSSVESPVCYEPVS